MKNLKKVLALVLAVVMIMGVVTVASAKTYTDVKATDDYATAIDILSNLKILDGFKDGDNYSFKSGDKFTRAQAAKIVAIVHNAATNGKIKDQTAISALYSNAQNPFVDCNSSWALPFINYCRITGLADGMTATTYEPNRYVTGVQFLKLMLTTLNFNTAKEGYTGTGWDVNVLNRANEVGLTAGLKDGWKAIDPITRGEAAQVLYNALTAYLVEYGQNIKAYNPEVKAGTFLTKAFVANESVAATGVMLAAKMGIGIARTTDKFRRPGYTWSYDTWTGFYMDTPKAEFKTAVTECEILKAMGIAENKTTKVNLNGWYKGVAYDADHKDATSKASKLLVDGKSAYFTALNYYAVDGRKYARMSENDTTGIVLQHKTNKDCQKLHGTWTEPFFGGQGDLTQVFQTEDGWVVTTIHTFLAEVTGVNKNNKYSHATPESAEVKFWLQNLNERDGSAVPPYSEDTVADVVRTKAVTTVDYAKGTKVLVNLSLKKDEMTNYGTYYTWGDGKDSAVATIVGAADSKTGKLTGASGLNQAETVSIDGTKYPAACRFVMGKDAAMNQQNNKEAYTFYFDSYGNVIGREAVSATSNYVVMDKIWAHVDDGDFTVYANLYDLTGTAIEKVKVSLKAGSFKNFYAKMYEYDPSFIEAGVIATIAKQNDPQLTNALYTYTVDDKGVYTLNWTGAVTVTSGVNYGVFAPSTDPTGYGRLAGTISHKEKTAYLKIGTAEDPAAANTYINVSESTKFVVKGTDKTWKVYNGYSELPTLTAAYCDYTLEANNSYASLVYLGDATYESASITGYVPTWKQFRWAGSYALIDVYVDGELTTVSIKPEFTLNNEDYRLNRVNATYPKPGMYKFNSKTDGDGVVYCDVVSAEETLLAVGTASFVSGTSNDVTAFTVAGTAGAFNVSNTTIYFVKADGTIEKVDSSYIPGAYVAVYGTTDGGYHFAKTIYVFDEHVSELPAPYTVTP